MKEWWAWGISDHKRRDGHDKTDIRAARHGPVERRNALRDVLKQKAEIGLNVKIS